MIDLEAAKTEKGFSEGYTQPDTEKGTQSRIADNVLQTPPICDKI